MNVPRFTGVEKSLDRRARRTLNSTAAVGAGAILVEFLVFVVKQAWACVFGAALLAVIIGAHAWYPNDTAFARNDLITLAAIGIQIVMVSCRLETIRELRVVVLFHVVGTAMELFKTDAGSWSYDAGGVIRIGSVPLFSGFMYAAVGSYMVRVYRIFDLRFDRYPRRWVSAILAAAIYVNFFAHHFTVDVRLVLVLAVAAVFGRCVMHFRIFRTRSRLPLVVAFGLVALFIWFAENIATWSRAWLYPSQLTGWHPVVIDKLGSWFLLMIVSVVLVAWVYPPQRPIEAEK